jgi:dTDP-4-dehydrorhamnose 3,5-epimerase
MAYHCTPTNLNGVFILEPQVFGDDRGFFFESFNARDFEKVSGVTTHFVQDNHSKSAKGVLRGLHYQIPNPQGKLVRVTFGEVYDVVLDIRPDSNSFGQWVGLNLSAENKKQVWIPPGLAHGFLVVSDHAEFLYKTTEYWFPAFEKSIAWNDPQLAIDWPLSDLKPKLSEKDRTAPSWLESIKNF